jgi:hypothetical protein
MGRKLLARLMIRHWLGLRRTTVGKLALAAEIVALLVAVAWGFADILDQSEQLSSAAWAGARYGIQSPQRWTDYLGMVQAARVAEGDTSDDLSILAQQVCTCPEGGTISCRGTCAERASPRVYVQVTISKEYALPLSFSFAGNPITLTSHAMMRVQ